MSMQQDDGIEGPFPSKSTAGASLLRTFMLSIVCQGIATVGLYIWSQSEWLWRPGPYPLNWEGYDFIDFLGLMSFTVFGPVGFCLMFVGFQTLLRRYTQDIYSSAKLILITILAIIILLALSAFGIYWGYEILICGVVGCVNTPWYTWPSSMLKKTEAGVGFKTTVGIPMVITGLALIITLLISLRQNLKSLYYNAQHAKSLNSQQIYPSYDEPLLISSEVEENPIPKNPNLKRYTPYNTHLLNNSKPYLAMSDSSDTQKRNINHFRLWRWFIVWTIFIALYWLFATYVPNNWEYFYPARIAEKAALKVTTDGQLCSNKWKEYTCPEHDDAVIRTHGLQITEQIQLKIFPSNAAFYSLLFAIPFLSLCAQTFSPSINEFMSKRIRVPCPWNSTPRDRVAFFTLYELTTMILVLAVVYIFFHYWYWDHNYNGYWPNPDGKYGIHVSERLSRTMGQVAVFFFALLMFPAARNSPLLAMLGVSWEASIQYHRWLGTIFFFCVILHMLFAYWWYWKDGSIRDIYRIPMHLPQSTDNFTVPIIQWLVWAMIISIGLLTICWSGFRRKRRGIFKYNTSNQAK